MPIAPMAVRRLALRCGGGFIGLAVLLALAWFMGWQQPLGRLDPVLVIPWLMPILCWQAWRMRGQSLRDAGASAVGLLTALLAVQAAMVLFWADASAGVLAAQLLAVALAFVLCWLISGLVGRWHRLHGALIFGICCALTLVWMVAAHMALLWAYSPAQAGAGAGRAIMITSLPLRWAGSDDFTDIFSGRTHDDIVLQKLEHLGPISLVDSLDGTALAPDQTLFLAHPRAMTPQDLVAVDAHVRSGGRALILADALSSWPAAHPLGDTRNPPITSLLTPLLDHWGIILSAAAHGEGGATWQGGRDHGLWLHSNGRFQRWPSQCQILGDDRALTCQIGRGRAMILGDADLLYAPLWEAEGWDAAHLMKSDVLYWTAQQLWGRHVARRWLQPIWIKPEYRRAAGIAQLYD